MKKIIIPSILLLGVMACVASPNYIAEEQKEKLTPAVVYYAPIPKNLEFAGEKVPLEYPDVKEALQREISVTMYMHSSSIRAFRAMSRYFPVIEPILKKHGIPDDFKYLAMAESGLNPEAISTAKASGLWQFMTAAAKQYGVETGSNVDLRYNVEIATEAACKYLKDSYKRFGNWTLVAASYNLGVAGVSKRVDVQGVDSYYDLFIPQETMRYVYRILSMKIIGENLSDYGFMLSDEDCLKPFENYTEIKVNHKDIKWSELAAKHGTNYKILRLLNPWIRSYEYSNSPGTTYTVKVPNKDFRTKGY